MHHVIVTRVSITLCILFAGCVLGFAWLSAGAPESDPALAPAPAARGEALFQTYCGRCHDVAELVTPIRDAADREALLAEWEAFLGRHGRADAAQDRIILEFLAQQANADG